MHNRNHFSLTPWQQRGLALLRIVTGLLMAYHGWEVFDSSKIAEYATWPVLQKLPAPLAAAYVGKGVELLTGLCLALGFFTRAAGLVLALNLLFITFKIGNGRFWYEDQHPFLFALLGLVFFFAGPVCWSVDGWRQSQSSVR